MTANESEQNSINSSNSELQTEFVEISFDEDASRIDWAETWKSVRFYALPLISFLLFLLIVVGTVLPNISAVFYKIDEINILREKDTKLSQRLTRLANLAAQQAQRDVLLAKINEIVPTSQSQVVTFRQRVIDTAANQSVKLDSAVLGEVLIEQDSDNTESIAPGLFLVRIPSDFTLSGQIDGFRRFLSSLYLGEDFFVVNELNLRRLETEEGFESWSAQMNLVKYQFFTSDTFDPIQAYNSVSEQVIPSKVVVDFLQNRFLGGVSEVESSDEITDINQ